MVFTVRSSPLQPPEASDMEEHLKPRNQWTEFCEETTLNGWYYLAKQNIGKLARSYWSLVVLGSLIVAGFFVYGATDEFLNSTVIITVDSVTASLEKVLFPSLVVCNQNQVNYRQLSVLTLRTLRTL